MIAEDRFFALRRFSPSADTAEEILGAFMVSQGLDCLAARRAEVLFGDLALEGLCPGRAWTAEELAETLCSDVPLGAPYPEEDALELWAVDQQRGWHHAASMEAVQHVTELAADPSSLASMIQVLVTFQHVRDADQDWDADGALRCADAGLSAAESLNLSLHAAQYVEAMAFAWERGQDHERSKLHFDLARERYAALEDAYYTRRLEGNYAAKHSRRESLPEEAASGSKQALQAFIATRDTQRAGRSLIKQAMNAYYDYDLDAAETLAQTAAKFGRDNGEGAIEGGALIALGHSLSERGDLHGASVAYRSAMERFSPQGGTRLFWLNAFSALIDVELRTLEASPGADYEQSLSKLDTKVTRAEAFLAELSPEQWVELNLNHARIKLGLGHLEEARALASAVRKTVDTDELTLWRVTLTLLEGDIADAEGNAPLALEAYRAAERSSIASGDLTQTWTSMLGQASVYRHKGDRRGALAELDRAAQVVESLWRQVASSQGDEQDTGSATFLESQISLYDRAVETLLEGSPSAAEQVQAWWWLERRRSNELRLRLGHQPGDGQPAPASAQAWLKQVQSRLAGRHNHSDGLIVEYHVSRDAAYVFVIGPEELVTAQLTVNGAQLAEAIAIALPNLEQGPGAQLNDDKLRELSSLLLAPVAGHLVNGAPLTVIPDGRLTLVPFELLYLPGTHDRLLEQHAVAYNTSASALLIHNQDHATSARGLLSVAIGDGMQNHEGQAPLPPLPCAEAESRSLMAGPEDRSLRGSDATEDAFRAQAPHYDILHIAAHGTVEEGSWRRSSLALWPGEEHDGMLTLEEIANLDLNARLAVLPACRSAVARIFRGEGIQGVGGAFRRAGVPTTVVGLWDLPDVQGTSALVVRFVDYARRGLPQSEALRRAKLDVIKQGGSYEIWAPLVLYGEGGPLVQRPEEDLTLAPLQGQMNARCRTRPVRDLLGDLQEEVEDLSRDR